VSLKIHMSPRSSKYRRDLLGKLIAERREALEAQARGSEFWREMYQKRSYFGEGEEIEDRGFLIHNARYERVVKEIHRLAHLKVDDLLRSSR
jgi:hypothetical protein